ncbi:MAG: phosphate signaling complex protein PhoU [Candidatus Omnitrophica bacterium]|nr:phosphate signaling complex protein PhoU [Candidatus Omnitrophota bacterium]
MFEDKEINLKKEIIEYANLIEKMIQKSIEGLLKRERNLLNEVIQVDEPRANRWEIDIDELCTTIIAQFEPKAKDLRTILMSLKMNNDLERMGDHAVNISESAIFLIDKPPIKPLIDIPRMADEATKMLKDSIESFINEDAKLARNVCERDDIVDSLHEQVYRELITFMISDSSVIQPALYLIRVSNNLERIADLTTNICEDVIFMAEGRVIKHNIEE